MTVSVTGLVCLKPGAFGHRCYRMRTHIGTVQFSKVRRAFTSVAAGERPSLGRCRRQFHRWLNTPLTSAMRVVVAGRPFRCRPGRQPVPAAPGRRPRVVHRVGPARPVRRLPAAVR